MLTLSSASLVMPGFKKKQRKANNLDIFLLYDHFCDNQTKCRGFPELISFLLDLG